MSTSPSLSPDSSSGSIGLKEIYLTDITVGEYIGEGSFGIVRKGNWRGMDVALKIPRYDNNPIFRANNASSTIPIGDLQGDDAAPSSSNSASSIENMSKEYAQEIETMALVCNHANIIQFVGVVTEVSTISPCIVTAYYANGSIYDKLFKHSEITPDVNKPLYSMKQKVQWAIQTAQGVHHLHQEGVIHRDLATRNLQLDDLCNVRVADFGLARTKEVGASKGFTQSDLGLYTMHDPTI